MIDDKYLENDYLDWIIDELNLINPKKTLMAGLNRVEFLWVIDNDRRRASDGIAFRERFPLFHKLSNKDQISPCTVLEMLAALAIRMDKEWIGNARKNRAFIPFQDMVRNLGLTSNRWTGKYFNDVNAWMLRRFSPDGLGSIFPLRHPDGDQTEKEIWMQMIRYIGENY